MRSIRSSHGNIIVRRLALLLPLLLLALPAAAQKPNLSDYGEELAANSTAYIEIWVGFVRAVDDAEAKAERSDEEQQTVKQHAAAVRREGAALKQLIDRLPQELQAASLSVPAFDALIATRVQRESKSAAGLLAGAGGANAWLSDTSAILQSLPNLIRVALGALAEPGPVGPLLIPRRKVSDVKCLMSGSAVIGSAMSRKRDRVTERMLEECTTLRP